MKKRASIYCAAFCAVLIAGCAGQGSAGAGQGTQAGTESNAQAGAGDSAQTPQAGTGNAAQTPQAGTEGAAQGAAGGNTSAQDGSGQSQASEMSAEQATAIALEHAGLKESDVQIIGQKLEMEHGRAVYDIEFYSGNKEYDYEIDAATGEILSHDFDIEGYLPPEGNTSGSTPSDTAVTLEQAKEAALAQAGVNGQEVHWLKEELDRDDGRMVYELEFVSGAMEYELKIDAQTGDVLEFEKDHWDD